MSMTFLLLLTAVDFTVDAVSAALCFLLFLSLDTDKADLLSHL